MHFALAFLLAQRTKFCVVTFPENRRLSIPKSALINREDGTYYLPLSAAKLENNTSIIVVPVIHEEAEIHKERIETGKVRLTKTVREEQVSIDEPIFTEQVEVERIPINQYVDAPVEVRYEDGKTIIPVLEEVLVVEKRLMLREEIHITTRREMKQSSQEITLKREEINVERTDSQNTNL
jgi:uncharacterized protein (TIGR02271 family)